MVDAVSTVWAKEELVYGTDAVPTGALNGVLTRNFSMKPLEVDRIDRNLDQLVYGAQSSAPSNKRMTSSYEVEIAGAGTAGDVPRWMELLKACGMAAPVIDEDVSATQQFAPVGAPVSSLTQYSYWQDQLRRMVGSVGSFTIDFTAGAYPFFGFNWTGLLGTTPFAKSAPGETDLSDFVEPVEVNIDNTSFTLGGYAAPLRSLKLDAGVTVVLRNLVNKRYVRRGNHALTGSAVIEAPDISVRNYLAELSSGATVPMALDHGVAPGNEIGMAWAKVQITSIDESEEDDTLMWTLGLTCTVDGGAADLVITAK